MNRITNALVLERISASSQRNSRLIVMESSVIRETIPNYFLFIRGFELYFNGLGNSSLDIAVVIPMQYVSHLTFRRIRVSRSTFGAIIGCSSVSFHQCDDAVWILHVIPSTPAHKATTFLGVFYAQIVLCSLQTAESGGAFF